MSVAEYIEIWTQLLRKSESGFYKWFRNKYEIVVAKHNNGFSGKVTYLGQTIERYNENRNDVSKSIAKDILQAIAASYNYHIPLSFDSIDIVINEESVFLVMMGNCTINDVYKFDETRYGFNQLMLHRIYNHVGKHASPLQISKTIDAGDDFVNLCARDINKGICVMVDNDILTYFCFTDIVSKPRSMTENSKFIPFNIYDFIEVMIMLGTKLSSNLLQIRNRDLALGYCFEYIDVGVD